MLTIAIICIGVAIVTVTWVITSLEDRERRRKKQE